MKACWSRGYENEYNTRQNITQGRIGGMREKSRRITKTKVYLEKKCTMKLKPVYAGFKII